MAKREQFFRLFDIINILKKKPNGATYNEISDYVETQHQSREDETSMIAFSEKTFKRDRDLIFSFFGIEIQYKRSTHTYRIDDTDNLDQANAIYDNLLLVNAYRKTKNDSDILFFERRQARGLHNLEGLIYAIKNNKKISLNYTKYWEGIPHRKTLEPYAMKEFRNRWYLIANDSDGDKFILKSYGLDRITDLDIQKQTFEKLDIDIDSLFTNSFGIVSAPDEKPDKIILSFVPWQGNYVKSLPLHASQKILVDSTEELRIELTLVPTYDFYQELLTHAERLKIIEPPKVKKEFLKFLQIAQKLNQ